MARMCLYGYIRRIRIFFGMIEVVYHLLLSTDLETTTPHDATVVYFTECLSVLFQLMNLNELCGECNRVPGNEANYQLSKRGIT